MQDTVVVRPRPVPAASQRLVCLGFCGGGAGSYLAWTDVMPPGTELAAVCYPGREGRFAEEFARDWDELAEDAVSAVLSAADLPYVLFGHSMGGWMAFDVAARIEERGGPAPASLVVSSANAPSRGLTPQDMFPAQADSDGALMDWMTTFGLMPEHVLDDPDLSEIALELMRADIRVRDSFYHREGATVSAPLQVLTGASDEVIDPRTGQQWRKLATGPFRHDELPGGHFYTPEVWQHLPDRIAALGAPGAMPDGSAYGKCSPAP
ncbi:alpha/beta fold hydrolase [Streptomyces sp. NPDC048506]|uniref:thioesterase II family protein n=1 Tax=Streptomyces sp. NPDC048506 TaxID=3155028 RepID=UPI00341E2DA2